MRDRSISDAHHDRVLPSLFATSVVVLAWLLCTIAQVEKYLGVARASALMALGAVCIVWLLAFLRRLYRQGQDFPRWSLLVVLGLLFVSFALLYPRSLHPLPGKGSDREDALRVELYAVTHHQYPYDARTFLNHPPTPLPGAMWLAAPFYATGRIAVQNLFWAGLFGLFLIRFFARQGTAAAFMLIFVLTALENLNDFDVGGDYLTNVFYFCIAISLFAQATKPSTSAWRMVGAVCLLGLALSSRALYAVTITPVLAYGIRNGSAKRTILMFLGVLLVAICVTLPVFLPHPVARLSAQLAQNANKLQLLPPYLPATLLTFLAFLLASLSFWLRRLALPEVFGFAGAAVLLLTFPPMAFIVKHEGGWTRPLTTDLEYLAPAAVFLGLWALSIFERGSLAGALPAER